MKPFLVLLLFALTTCSFLDDLIKLANCVVKNKTIRENLPKVIESLETGDYANFVQVAVKEFHKVKEEIKECMAEPVLKLNCDILTNRDYYDCRKRCNKLTDPIGIVKLACIQDCIKNFCH